jgi:hypothetical protein
VVSDVVDNGQALFSRGFAKAAAELLHPEQARFRRAEHHGVDVRKVEALVEDVDGEEDVELARFEPFQGLGSRSASGPVWTEAERSPFEVKYLYEVRVPLGAAEGEGPRSSVFSVLLEGVFGALLGGDGVRERLLVEAGASPGNVLVVDVVGNADVAEGGEKLLLDTPDERSHR